MQPGKKAVRPAATVTPQGAAILRFDPFLPVWGLRCAVKSRRHQAASAALPRQKFLANVEEPKKSPATLLRRCRACRNPCMVPGAGLEPAQPKPRDFKSLVSTNSTIRARGWSMRFLPAVCNGLQRTHARRRERYILWNCTASNRYGGGPWAPRALRWWQRAAPLRRWTPGMEAAFRDVLCGLGGRLCDVISMHGNRFQTEP